MSLNKLPIRKVLVATFAVALVLTLATPVAAAPTEGDAGWSFLGLFAWNDLVDDALTWLAAPSGPAGDPNGEPIDPSGPAGDPNGDPTEPSGPAGDPNGGPISGPAGDPNGG